MFVKMSVLAYPIALVTVFSSFIMFTTIEIVHFLFNLLPRSVKEVLESPGWLLKALSCLSSLRFLCTGNPRSFLPSLHFHYYDTFCTQKQPWWRVFEESLTDPGTVLGSEHPAVRVTRSSWIMHSRGDRQQVQRQVLLTLLSQYLFHLSVSLHL